MTKAAMHPLWLAQWIEHQTMNLAVVGSNPAPLADANHRLHVPQKHEPSPNGDERFAGQPAAARANDETDAVPVVNWRVRCVEALCAFANGSTSVVP